ncbi:hypothetical protein [Paenibacillus arenilitoris]|uniref:hypothetical protein n=1 Tax=Paenibacillus arenilitoris TaxID=2772299 RepID=UPI001CC26188|nr:hypothetical protein [Paenibacillus arenilitoris]
MNKRQLSKRQIKQGIQEIAYNSPHSFNNGFASEVQNSSTEEADPSASAQIAAAPATIQNYPMPSIYTASRRSISKWLPMSRLPLFPSVPWPKTLRVRSTRNADGTYFIRTAVDSSNITIRGRGTIDGKGIAMCERKIPVPNKNEGFLNNLLVPIATSNFNFDGLILRDGGFWSFMVVRSDHVTETMDSD